MEKPANTDYPIHDLLVRRWSPLAFAETPVSTEDLSKVFEAARWAASCFNEQPWRFIVGTSDDSEGHARVLATLVEANQVWAKRAPVLIIAAARLTFTRNDKPNGHALYDTGQAVANLAVQATDLGLVVHQMAGFDKDKAKVDLSIPEGFEAITAIALGHPAEPDVLPESLQGRERAPRSRKSHEEIVFKGRWG